MIDVVLPVLNEAEALPWVLSRMPRGFRPIVIDNGSTDASATLARSHGAEVIAEPLRGFGAACWAGLQHAATDFVAFMDCDASLDPRDLHKLTNLKQSNDQLILGRRIGRRSGWPLHARAANYVLAAEVRRRTGLSIRDLGPMRLAPRRPLLELGITDRRFGWPLEMVLRAAESGWEVTEVPIAYRSRMGASKVTGTVSGTLRAIQDMSSVLRG